MPDTTADDLRTMYRGYIACLNRRDWSRLGDFVNDDVVHNGRRFGLSGYRDMLETDVRDIPDLHFDVELLLVEPPVIACRLLFECSPVGTFLGLAVDGRRISFAENIFYEIARGKIATAWSIIDKSAVESQLAMKA